MTIRTGQPGLIQLLLAVRAVTGSFGHLGRLCAQGNSQVPEKKP